MKKGSEDWFCSLPGFKEILTGRGDKFHSGDLAAACEMLWAQPAWIWPMPFHDCVALLEIAYFDKGEPEPILWALLEAGWMQRTPEDEVRANSDIEDGDWQEAVCFPIILPAPLARLPKLTKAVA